MSDQTDALPTSSRSDSQRALLDERRHRFEDAWQAGRRPRIEPFLADVPEPVRTALLAELLSVELAWRRRLGESPARDDYATQFPGDADLITASCRQSEPPDAPTLPAAPVQADNPTIMSDDTRPFEHRRGPDGPAPAAGTILEADGPRYQVLRVHAQGGLGVVFVAHDADLRREVALKEIRGEFVHDLDRETRFLREAEITGGLEHPGIVPVHGLGRHRDGRPYYVMRLIRGESFKEAIARFHQSKEPYDGPGPRAVEFRKLLARFLDVCNAMDYAHSQGVIHRDLKPANVMLGPFGEALVVDWGLAKVLDRAGAPDEADAIDLRSGALSDVTETAPGSALGTPQYMSPEQAAGRLDLVGPLSDVYSLGAMLYCLLTGKPPIEEKTLANLLTKVRQGDFASPRTTDRRGPRPLEALCLKAMTREPEGRYESVRKLADDVERWLADEPVSSFREPPFTRLGRWARRHQPLVAGASALLVTAVAALSVGVVLVGREQALKEVQRQRAEVNFARARDAVEQMLVDVGDVELADVPQMGPVRKRLLEKALHYYLDFLTETPHSPAIRLELGRARNRLGAIHDLLGDSFASEAAYRRAIAELEAFPAATPDLARAHDGLGGLLKKANRFQESEAAFKTALKLRLRLVAEQPDDPAARQGLADSRYHLGTLLARLPNRGHEDEDAYREAVRIQGDLVAQARTRVEARRKLGRMLNNLGLLLAEAGRSNEAESRYREALTIQEASHRADPDKPGDRWQLARTESNLGVLSQRTGRSSEAEERLSHARDLMKRLAADWPDVPDYRHELASILNNLGLVYAATARPREAVRAYREALSLRDRLAADFPNAVDYLQKRAGTRLNLALALAPTDPKAARDAYRDALNIQEALTNRFPDVPEYRFAIGRTWYSLARLLIDQEALAEAQPMLEQAIRQHRLGLESSPRNQVGRGYLRDDLGMLAVVGLGRNDHEAAARAAEELGRLFPDDPVEVASAAAFLAECVSRANADTKHAEADRRRLADDYARRAVALLRQAIAQGVLKGPELLDRREFRPLDDCEEFRKLKTDWKRSKKTGIARLPDQGAPWFQRG